MWQKKFTQTQSVTNMRFGKHKPETQFYFDEYVENGMSVFSYSKDIFFKMKISNVYAPLLIFRK